MGNATHKLDGDRLRVEKIGSYMLRVAVEQAVDLLDIQ